MTITQEHNMNFNFDHSPEYSLNTSLTEELIKLYGIHCKFLVTEKINMDSVVFGDFSHYKTNNADTIDMFMLPENTDEWENSGMDMSFGLMEFNNISLFVPRSVIINAVPENQIVGNLIVLPSGKIIEITNFDLTTPGINNQFTSDVMKSAFKITCKPYDSSRGDEVDRKDDEQEELDDLLGTLDQLKFGQDTDASEEKITAVIPGTGVNGVDEIVQKPTVSKEETDVWGKFG